MNAVANFLIVNAGSTQFLLFATIMVGMWVIEKTAFAERARVKIRHTLVNALFMSAALPVQILMMFVCLGLATWTARNHVGLVYQLPYGGSPWIKYGLMFFALDFLDYVYHSAMHRVPFFWRFHLAHHTDRVVDVSTTFREHAGETVIRNAFLMLWVLLCGATVEILVLRQTFETVANILAHTSMRLPPRTARVLGWLFITPNLHQAHHHFQMPATNRNYGDVFSIWDRLFGTFTDMAVEDIKFGLDTDMGVISFADLRREGNFVFEGSRSSIPRS